MTTQLKTIAYPVDQIIGSNIKDLLVSSEFDSFSAKINKVILTGEPEYHVYNVKGMSYLVLIDKIEPDVVAVHEVFDDVDNRAYLKQKLWVASGNWHKQLYNKDVG